MASKKQTAAERVIEKFNGAVIVAQVCGIERSTPHQWVRRGGYIPHNYQKTLLDAAKKRGIDLQPADLVNL